MIGLMSRKTDLLMLRRRLRIEMFVSRTGKSTNERQDNFIKTRRDGGEHNMTVC